MNILTDIDLKPYNTFQLSCIAKHFVEVTSIEQFQELTQTTLFKENKKLYLGGGSNILLTAPIFDGLVIKNGITGIYQAKTLVPTEDQHVRVGGGEVRNDFVRRCIDNNFVGGENLVHIPGSVGAAPIQNIGAYGVEAGQIVSSVEGVLISSGELLTLGVEECEFGYRTSIFKKGLKGKIFITHVNFKLDRYYDTGAEGEDGKVYTPHIDYGAIKSALADTPDDQITPRHVANAIVKIRNSKLPDWTKTGTVGTAGSFFKNPIITTPEYNTLLKTYPHAVGRPITPIDQYLTTGKNRLNTHMKLSAGQLIDLCGLKGLTRGSTGDVGTYDKHALVLINHGEGTGTDLVQLAKHIQDIVRQKTGISLEPEVNYV